MFFFAMHAVNFLHNVLIIVKISKLKNFDSQESQGYDNGRDLNDDDYEARKVLRLRAILGIKCLVQFFKVAL